MRALVGMVFAALVLLHVHASPASGQSILVQVTEAESGRPISGAFVSLLDEEGQVLRSALTNDSGRFLFALQGPGVFVVKGEMIGRESNASSAIRLAAGESRTVELALAVHAIPLMEIRVEADQQCRVRPEEASEIARVWDEARKALAVQAWTEEGGRYRLQLTTYERELDRNARSVQKENRRESVVATRTPFGSLPPEDLLADGFIRPVEGGGHDYFAPDAGTLLSDGFLDTHCLRLTRSGDLPNSIGLSFEPVVRSDFPDIEGTLWLEEETSYLQLLEYRYTWAPYREAWGVAGGRVEFEAMPDGGWIIHRWWIRAPILAHDFEVSRAGDSGIRVTGILERGGEVAGILNANQQQVARVERGSLTGLVWDSTRSRPLEGATVYLSGTQYAGVTDVEGRFRLDEVPDGVFTVSFTHPRLDSLGVIAAGAEVELTAGETSEVDLAIPSAETILVESCRAEGLEEGAAVLSGSVRDPVSGEPIAGATVRVEWQEVQALEPVTRATDRWLEIVTDADGRYTACGIPSGELVQIQASFLDWRGPAVRQDLHEGKQGIVNLEVELPPNFFTPREEAPVLMEERGTQGVQGRLVEPETGDPIRSAEVSIRDAITGAAAAGLTDARGFFRLQTPVAGPYRFSARALGYQEVIDHPVDVGAGELTVLEIRMAPEALELEPLVVSAERRSFHLEMQGFYDRRDNGLNPGVFMGPEIIEERRPRKVTDLFFGLTGVRVAEQSLGAGGRAVYFRIGERPGRSGSVEICWPMVYVDRHLVSTGGLGTAGAEPTSVDEFARAQDVAGIEVYRSPARVPPEFNGPNAGCGVVVIWTLRGGGPS